MPEQVIMAQVNAANQVSQLLAASGSKTFTVGKVSASAGNAGGMITLTPSGGGSAVAVKLEGARQAADLSGLVGKTVAVSKPSVLAGAGAGNNWMMLQPVKAGTAKVAGSSVTMLKLEGARQGMTAASLTGQKFTVVQPMMAGKTAGSTLFLQPASGGDLVALKMANTAPAASGLVGKTVTVSKAPMVAGGQKGAWLALKPAGGAVAAKAAVPAVAATAPAMAPVAMPANGGAVAMTVNQEVARGGAMKGGAAMAGTFPPGVEVEGLRNGAAAKAKKGAAAKAKAGMAAKAKAGGAKAAAAKGGAKMAGAKAAASTKAATTLKATPVAGTAGGAKMMNVAAVSSAGSAGASTTKSAGIVGMGLGGWGVAVIGVLGAAAAYGYYRSRQVEAELSAQEEEAQEAPATA